MPRPKPRQQHSHTRCVMRTGPQRPRLELRNEMGCLHSIRGTRTAMPICAKENYQDRMSQSMQDEEKIKLRGIPIYIFCLFMQNGLHNGLVLIATTTLEVIIQLPVQDFFVRFGHKTKDIFRPDKIINCKVASSRPFYNSIWDPYGQISQYLSIKFPLHKHSENAQV